jgi:putative DNA primase/helicase
MAKANDTGKNFKPLSLAQAIVKRLQVHRLSHGPKAQLISFDENSGLYVVGEEPIRLAAQRNCGQKVKEFHIREILSAVRRNAPLIGTVDLNDPKRRIITFKNLLLNLATMRPNKNGPAWLYTIGIPHYYNVKAKCPRFDRFIQEILPKEAHLLVMQILGYLLIPSTAFRKCFVFLGEGANGKSTLIQVIEAMLGHHNVSHHSLQDLANNRFATFDLFGKLANTYADLDSCDVKSAGKLKQIVSGDSMFYEQKHQTPFSGPVTARLVFSANKMPIIRDTSNAIRDRLILLDFPHRFEECKQDRNLIHKLTTEGEIEGIIATWAIPGLNNLLESGQFSIPEKSYRLMAEYQRESDPIREFIEQQVEEAPQGTVGKLDLYKQYEEWCEEQRIGIQPQREFNHRISKTFGIPDNQDFRAPGSRERIWKGIHLRDPDNPKKSEQTENKEQIIEKRK